MNYPPADTNVNNEKLAENGGETNQPDFVVDENLNPGFAPETKTKQPSKMFFLAFIILGFGTLIFGFISLANNIKSPFYTAPATEIQNTNNTIGEQTLSAAEIAALKTTDTDSDGLSDYDETYTHKTSPYLADTDSDGYSDKQEIDSNHDPLCPAGRDCRTTVSTEGAQTNIELPVDTGALDQAEAEATGGTAELTEEQKAQLSMLSAAEVRQLLLESGQMTQAQLDKITDEQLMQIFLDSLK